MMKYRDIEYTVIQGIGRHLWKWSASVADVVITGQAHSKSAAVAEAFSQLATGSLFRILFQNESSGTDKKANWLPAPKGEFIPMMRMYYPAETSPSILDGSWKIPPVVKVGNRLFRLLRRGPAVGPA
jgi:hypothetical protein